MVRWGGGEEKQNHQKRRACYRPNLLRPTQALNPGDHANMRARYHPKIGDQGFEPREKLG